MHWLEMKVTLNLFACYTALVTGLNQWESSLLKEQCAHNNKILKIIGNCSVPKILSRSPLRQALRYETIHIFAYNLWIRLRIRHIGLENLKNYCRSFSSSRAQKRCAPGDTAPLSHSHGLLHKFVKGSVTARTVYVRSRAFCGYGGNLFNLIKIMTKKLGLMHKMHDIQFKV